MRTSPVSLRSSALRREADGSMAGIWRIKLRRWREASRYAGSVVRLLDGCDLSLRSRQGEYVSSCEEIEEIWRDQPFLVSSG